MAFPIALFGVLIGTLWFVLFLDKKAGDSLNLTTEDRIITCLILAFTAGAFILQVLSWAGITPATFESYSFYIEAGLFIIGVILVFVLAVRRRRRKKAVVSPQYVGLGPWLGKKDIPRFSEKLRVLKEAQRPELRKAAIEDFESMVGMLPPAPLQHWSRKLRKVVFKTLDYLQGRIPKSDFAEKARYVDWIRTIVGKKDRKTTLYCEKLFLTTVDEFANDPEFQRNAFSLDNWIRMVLALRQELHEYEEKFMLALADEAIFHWDDTRFRGMWSNISVENIRVTDKETFQRVREHFLNIIDEAKISDRKDKQTIIENANAFFGRVKNR
jgi:hypothetical protein